MTNCECPETIDITQGEEQTINLWFVDSCGHAYPITGGTVVTKFKNNSSAEDPVLEKTATIVNGGGGHASVTLDEDETGDLLVGLEQDIVASLVISGVTKIIIFSKILNVYQQPF